MFEVNGIVYASDPAPDMIVVAARYVGNQQFVVTFSTGETRLFDATDLRPYPVFEPLENESILAAMKLSHGVMEWLDGEIDIAPEAVYEMSHEYPLAVA